MDKNIEQEISQAIKDGLAGAIAEREAELKKREEVIEEKEKEVNRPFTPAAGGNGDKGPGNVVVITDESDQPFENLGDFLKAVAKAGGTGTPIREMRLKRCVEGALDPITKAPTGLGEHVPNEGAFLVAQEFVPTLQDRMYETAIVYGRCSKQQIGANFNGIKQPAIDETSRADGYRWGGVRAYWTAEGGTKNASQPKFRQISLELEKLAALCYVTDELLEDSVALGSYVNRWYPLEMGFKLDDAIINGDGVGKPIGVVASPARVTVTKETGQAAATIVTNNILKMYRRLWQRSLAGAVWFINQDTLEQLATLTIPIGTAGTLANLFQFPTGPNAPAGGGASGTMLTKPVYAIEQCQTIGTEGDIILVDLGEYLVIEKGGLQSASSIHVAFTSDQTVFRFVYRCNGMPVWSSALTPYKGTDTISPYITLQTRS